MVQRWQRMAHRQRDKLHATGDEERFRADKKCIGPFFDKRCKGSVDVCICARGDDFGLPPDGRSRRLQFCDKGIGNNGIVRVDEHAKACCSRQQLVEQPEPLVPIPTPKSLIPVALPPGRLRLATRPIFTGSAPMTKTMGIVSVAALAASVAAVLPGVTMAVTRRRTSSAARAGRRSFWPSAQRYSIATF